MAEENKKTENKKEKIEKKEEIKKATVPKTEEKKQDKGQKIDKKDEVPKKQEAIVNGKDLRISTKHSIAVCDFIRGKTIDKALLLLIDVLRKKKAVPMKGEVPHRKGKGMERGRYPINAVEAFIKLLRQLAANATINGLEIEKLKIECKANRASRPYRRFGRQKFKRSHVTLILRAKQKKKNKKANKKPRKKK